MIQVRIDDKYEVIKKLREGGMGAIYLVRHRLLEELRVIKVLRSQLTTDEELRERFQREARAAIQLRHPNIAQLYDFSIDEEGTAYIVLEFIDGITFEEFAQQPEARHLPLTLALAQQGLRALAYLHRKGFVHRDIAPDNLMLTRDVDGEPLVKLIDLGIVKILRGGGQGTATSLYLGKPKYSSPEQLMSAAIDERSDLYSFGVMLYELVTGLYPIQGHDLPSLLTGHLHREPVSFDVSDPGGAVPESLRRLILRALAKHPEERFASAEEFSRQLGEVAATLTPREQGAERELLDAARAGAQRARAEAIAGAERAVREHLEQHDFVAAREQLSLAVARLGNDTRLAELLRAIESEEREHHHDATERERLVAMATAAERALDRGNVAEARAKLLEILARDPQHPTARALRERIERLLGEQGPASSDQPTVISARAGQSAAAPPASAAHAPAAVPAAAAIPLPASEPPTAPDAGARIAPPRRRGLAFAGLALLAIAVAVAGWLLWGSFLRPAATPAAPAAGNPDATAAYLAGTDALARGDAAEAARHLRAALALDGDERPGYLPWFELGRALIAAGDCAEGLKALAASERAGVVLASPAADSLPALRAACQPVPELEAELVPVAQAIATLERQIAEIEGSQTSGEVAAMWAADAALSADFATAKELVAEAAKLLAQARAERNLDLAYQAGDRAADARAKLAAVLRAVTRR